MKREIITILAVSALSLGLSAQSTDYNTINDPSPDWEYEVKIAYNLGGDTPLPLPVEIRSIEAFNPGFNPVVEGVISRWFGQIGISSGVSLSRQSMITEAMVKSYATTVVGDEGDYVSGYYTGLDHSEYSGWYISVPAMASYRTSSNKFRCRLGGYIAYRIDGKFTGYVTDGYLRNGTPVGEKIEFVDGDKGTYDFSDEIRKIQLGARAGLSWFFFRNFSFSADLNWSLSNTFRKSFESITFKMFPIYASLGIGYKL